MWWLCLENKFLIDFYLTRLHRCCILHSKRAHTHTLCVLVEWPESKEPVDSARSPRDKQQLLTSPKINRARPWERQPANAYNNMKKRGALRQLCLIEGRKPRKMWRDTDVLKEGEESFREPGGAWGKRGREEVSAPNSEKKRWKLKEEKGWDFIPASLNLTRQLTIKRQSSNAMLLCITKQTKEGCICHKIVVWCSNY